MSLQSQELFGIYPAVFDGFTLQHVSNVDPQNGIANMVVTPGGEVDPGAVLEINRKALVTFTGHDLGAILGSVSALLGMDIATAWKVQYQCKKDGGTFQTTSSHVVLKGTKGKLMLDSVSATQDEQKPLDVAMRFWPLWDGNKVDANNEPLPVEILIGQALTGVPAVNNVYKLGPVIHETVKLGGVQSSKVNFGVGYTTSSADGEKVARIGTIDERNPTFEVDIHNMTLLTNLTYGTTQSSDGMKLYFRNVAYADNTANHISFQMIGGAYEITPAGTNEKGKVMSKLKMTGKRLDYSGAAIMIVTVGVALP